MLKSYKQLVSKLNSFKSRYHLFQVASGTIIFLSGFLVYILIAGLTESQVYFSVFAKTILFYVSCILFLVFISWSIILPGLKWTGILPSLKEKQLANIISSHFVEIKDRLINLLELANENSDDLISASIEQKSQQLNQYIFTDAIKFKKLVSRIYLLLGIFLVSIILNTSLSGRVFEGLFRLIHYKTVYETPSPFSFVLLNDSLQVKRGENIILKVVCEGREVPDMMYINIAGSDYLMKGKDQVFEYELAHVNNSFVFYFTDKNYSSKKYNIQVLPSPMIVDFLVKVSPPRYTKVKEELLKNIGDLKIPYGSQVVWNFKTIDTDYLNLNFTAKSVRMTDNTVKYEAFKNENYSISIGNNYFQYNNLLRYDIEIIKDKYPDIELVQLRDSLKYSRYYFKGSIEDDYGFHHLSFNMVVNKKDTIIDIPIFKNSKNQNFYYAFDFKDIISAGESVYYYFEVADNDYLNDFKKTSSESFEFVFPSQQELVNMENNQFAEIDELMDKSYKLSSEISETINQLKFKSLAENISNWEKQQLASEIIKKKNELEDILQQIQEKNKKMNQFVNSFSEEKKEILEKQQEIESLLEDVLSDELKELFDEFNKLAQDFNSNDFNELSEKYDLSMDDLSEQLERNLQVLKRMKIEQKLERLIRVLSDLSDEEFLNSSTLDELKNFEEVVSKELINQTLFENVEKELILIDQLNRELLKPMKLSSFETEIQQIKDSFEDILEDLNKKRKNKAINGIVENSDQLDRLGKNIEQNLEQNQMKQNSENIQNLRQLLDNLVYISLSQEYLFNKLQNIDVANPVVNDVRRLQNDLINQSEFVKDSLYALAKRTPAIDNIVNKELVNMAYSLNKSLQELNDDQIRYAAKSQQNAITSINNIAVFLDEALKNMEDQMANSMPGDQQGDNPGKKGKEGLNMLKQSQQSLKEQMQQMIEQMKSGDGKSMSRRLGQTLSQQEMMQQMIRELLNSSDIGSSSKQQLQKINQLIEQNKADLIHKNINQQTINRQNLILDRLLKAEQAEIEREVDEQRESKSVEEEFFSNPVEFFEYKQKETNFDEPIYRNSYQLKKFYEEKYKNYINQLNKPD